MFKKLQRKFLWGSTLVLLLVIVLVIGIIFWVTSNTVSRQSQLFISQILDNDGHLPEQGVFEPREEAFLALNTESLNEIRFVSVAFSGDQGMVISKFMAGISDDDAVRIASEALEKNADSGHLNTGRNRFLHYGRRTLEDGTTLVVIADSTSRYGLSRLIILYMAGLWLIILVLFILFMSHYSKKLVRPFVENDEKQKRFITNASHELKTPLAVISANNEMAEAISGKTKWTESTSRQVKRLQSLIENLVVLTRLDEMKEISLTDIDLSSVISETAEPFRSVIESTGRKFDCQIEQDIHIQGEKRTIQQIASILLDNAAKYCDEEGAVSVRLIRKSKGAQLNVANTYREGNNVDTSRFFERFYREDESHHSGKSGFGIGLSMAKEMMERLKGKLEVSYEGDTIIFSVIFP